MHTPAKLLIFGALLLAAQCQLAVAQLSDVTQPGDPIIPSTANSPGSEAVANAIDNQPTKYLNFDSGRDGTNAGFSPSGFVVTPSVGLTHVRGIAMQSANDADIRDPKTITLEGSIDDVITGFNSGRWELITTISNIEYTARFQTNTYTFPNNRPYKHYRWVVTETRTTPNGCCMQIAEVQLLGTTLPVDVTQPGDRIIPSTANSPGSEGVANAIDNQPTKYLNFDSGRDGTNAGFSPSGFIVTPSIGRTLVTGLSMQSANDADIRDPRAISLEGSNDGAISNYNSGNWEVITLISNITAWPTVFGATNRFRTQTYLLDNPKPYRHYRWVVLETQTTPNGCCMQIAEVEFLGTSAPIDVTQPGDPIIPSSANSPGSEAVGNAIDNQPTKYLNFDSGRDGTNAGFSPSGFIVSPRVGPATVIGLTMQSANDADIRDPKTVTLEGSNDGSISNFNSGTWELITTISNIDYTARFQTNEFFFPNDKSYKHYRWIVTETRTTPNGCCMQIAEVEFLAVPVGGNTNVIDGLIRRQPQDTPVLVGSNATFRVFPRGPLIVQWFRNGVLIPGATTANYTTPSIFATNNGDRYYALVQSPLGQQRGDEVILSVFTPSATESFGFSWIGGGANGAPTEMLPDDITGFHRQAYWNNLPGGSGTLSQAPNSDNQPHPTVSVTWATSGEWGVGTGEGDPTERMLNGTATSFATTTDAAQTVTLSGVPAGSHSLLLYTVQVPLEFFNMNFAVVTFNADGTEKAIQQRFIRPQNADEYNPSPGFVLVTANNPTNRSVGNMLRFDNLQTDDERIQIQFFSPGRAQPAGSEPIRGPGLNAFQLLINPGPVPTPPLITQNPVSGSGIRGGQVTLSAQATGTNITYQWLKNGQAIRDATNSNLTLVNLGDDDEASYSVAISNPAGRIVSRVAVVDVLETDRITEGLIAYFKFDDTGDRATNSASGGQHGEVRGTPLPDWQAGQIGGGLKLGGGAYVFVPNYTKPTIAISVAGWVSADDANLGPVINNWLGGQAIGSRGQFRVDLESTGPNLRGEIGVGPNQPAGIDIVPDTVGWHHFAMTANGRTLSTYWDGELLTSVDYLGLLNAPPFPWLAIGADVPDIAASGAPTRTWNGILDDIALWGRSLSGVEVAAIYRAGFDQKLSVSQVPSVFTSAPDLRLGPAVLATNGLRLSWTGGTGLFLVQRKTSLSQSNWTDLVTTSNRTITLPLVGQAGFFRVSGNAQTNVLLFRATLNGAAERPTPVTTAGSGAGTFSLKGNDLTYYITYGNLSSAASAGHIHGPADTNTMAGVLIGFSNVTGTAGTLSGVLNLSDTQKGHLTSGMTYANIHTANFGGGEIRGQILP